VNNGVRAFTGELAAEFAGGAGDTDAEGGGADARPGSGARLASAARGSIGPFDRSPE
jgi:hypothetical protein